MKHVRCIAILAITMLGASEGLHAQGASVPIVPVVPPTSPSQPAPLSHQGRAALDAASLTRRLGSTAARCTAIVERARGLIVSARAFEHMESRFLGPLGRALTMTRIENLRRQGRSTEANQVAMTTTVDMIICRSGANPNICASWMLGRSLGEIINQGPRLAGIMDRSVNDWWTDKLLELSSSGTSDADIQRLTSAAREKREQAARDHESARQEQVRCEIGRPLSSPPRAPIRTETAAPAVPRTSAGERSAGQRYRTEGASQTGGGTATTPIVGACQITGTC